MEKIHIVYCFALSCIWLISPLAGVSHAEDGDVYLEQVTVTAEKKEANVQQVAIPITVLSRMDIEDRNIRELSDLTRGMPNLQFLKSGRPDGGSFNFRGLGMFGMSVLSEKSPVVIYYDGIPWDGRFGVTTDFGNIERIEFLRGPQGTLYGKNAMAGVINIITKDPTNETSGKISSYYEDRNAVGASFRVQTPLIDDKLFYSISGSADSDDGWMTDHTTDGKRDWDENRNKHVFMKGVYLPSSDLKLSLQYGYDTSHSGSAPYIIGKDITYDITTGFDDPEFNSKTHNAALKVDYEAGGFDVASITTFRSLATDSHQYFGFPNAYGFDDIERTSFTQELRFSSPQQSGQDHFEWLLGLFYSYDDLERDNTGYNFGGDVYNYPVTIESDTYSVFGEVTVPLFLKGLSATVGARYEAVERDMDHHYENYNAATGVYAAGPSEYRIDDTWSNVLGKFALEYKVNDDYMLYAFVAQGYSPGGFNYLETDKQYATFDEQRSIDYEVGLKAMMFSNRLMINPNFFYTEYEDLQISEEASPMKFVVVNAGKAHATGVEVDFNAKPVKSLSIFGGVGIIRSEYDDYEENMGTGTVDYSGNNITNTPDYTANLGVSYRHKSGLFGMVEYSRTGKTYLSKDNSEKFKRDAFSLVNTKVGWENDAGFEAYLYVRNLFDEEYITEVSEEYDMYMVGEPRTFGAQVAYRF